MLSIPRLEAALLEGTGPIAMMRPFSNGRLTDRATRSAMRLTSVLAARERWSVDGQLMVS